MTLRDDIERIRPWALEPERVAMGHRSPPPTPQGRVFELELELSRMRLVLQEALALLEVAASQGVVCSCYEAGRNPMCAIHGSSTIRGESF